MASQWQDELLAGLARLQLLIDGYRGIDRLPPELAAEVRSIVGWTQEQEALRARTGTRDRWQVIARRQTDDETLKTQFTWLHGASSNAFALVLEFAVGAQPLPATYSVGQVIDAELVFFDGCPPVRALEKERFSIEPRQLTLPAPRDIATLQTEYARILAMNPWFERLPFVLGPVRPLFHDGRLASAGCGGSSHPRSRDLSTRVGSDCTGSRRVCFAVRRMERDRLRSLFRGTRRTALHPGPHRGPALALTSGLKRCRHRPLHGIGWRVSATLGTRRAPLETQSLWPEASLAPLSEPASPERTLLRAASAQRLWDLAGARAAPEAVVTPPRPCSVFLRVACSRGRSDAPRSNDWRRSSRAHSRMVRACARGESHSAAAFSATGAGACAAGNASRRELCARRDSRVARPIEFIVDRHAHRR